MRPSHIGLCVSDLDRSLLLAQLVNLSGFEVRLARVELTEDDFF